MLARVDFLSEGGPDFHFGPRTRRGKGSLWERLRKAFGKISRRSFLGLAGATGVGVALTGCAPAAKQEEPAADSLPATGGDPLDYDTVSWSACHVNCGSRCPLKAYVKDGQVVRIDIDSDGDDEFGPGKIYQMRSCVRGRTNRQRIYSPDRIQKPLKRVEGTKRGEGKYEEITWDEAINLIATTMKEIKEEYGNDAFYIQYGTGVLGGTVSKSWHPDQTMFARLMNLLGRLPAPVRRLLHRSDHLGDAALQRRRLVEQRGDRSRELQEHRAVR